MGFDSEMLTFAPGTVSDVEIEQQVYISHSESEEKEEAAANLDRNSSSSSTDSYCREDWSSEDTMKCVADKVAEAQENISCTIPASILAGNVLD